MKKENNSKIDGDNNNVSQIENIIVLPNIRNRDEYIPDEYATKLLISAACDDVNPTIMFIKTFSGHTIQCGSSKFSVSDSRISKREMSYWEDALKNLIDNNYIVPANYKGIVFNVTKKGYDYFDSIKEETNIIIDNK